MCSRALCLFRLSSSGSFHQDTLQPPCALFDTATQGAAAFSLLLLGLLCLPLPCYFLLYLVRSFLPVQASLAYDLLSEAFPSPSPDTHACLQRDLPWSQHWSYHTIINSTAFLGKSWLWPAGISYSSNCHSS